MGRTQGELDLSLDAEINEHHPSKVKLSAQLDKMDVPGLFQQDLLLDTRSSGTITFEADGNGLTEIFKSLQGKAVLELEVRGDHNWQRAPTPGEQIRLSSGASLVINNERILGLELSALDIDSTEQDVTGNLSIVAEREPWLVAELESENLDIDGLKSLIPDSPEEADESNVLQAIRELGSMHLSLSAQTVVMPNYPLNNVILKTRTAPDMIKVEKLKLHGGGQST